MVIMALATFVMIGSAHASPTVTQVQDKSRFLFGIGYREQELQQAKSEKFASDTVGEIKHASFAGNTNIFIKGSGLATDPEANFIILKSQ